MDGDRPAVIGVVTYRDRGLVYGGWVLGPALVTAGAFAGAAEMVLTSSVLMLCGAWLVVARVFDLPRVELHESQVVVHSFLTSHVPYSDIRGFRTGVVWWWGRSGLILERGFGHETPIPAGLGLGPPRWHMALRDEIAARSDRELL